MTRQAKAESAFTPGISLIAAACAVVALLALAFASPASAAKKTAFFLGSPSGASGSTAGLLNQPRGVAVNQAGTGGANAGDVYVVEGANNRISQFKADGTFVRAFGQDVVSSGPDQAREVQWVTVNASEGTFKLTFGAETTPDLPYDETAANVAAALNGLTSINTGGGSVSVTGGPGNGTGSSPYVVTFDGGPLAGTNVAQMTSANGATPLGGGSGPGANEAKVLTARSGATGYEICNALANPTDVCKAGTSGGLGGAMNSPSGLAINQSTGHLYVTEGGDLRAQQFSATGQWVRAWGGDVVQPGGAGETFVQVNERQTVTLGSFLPPVTGGTFKLTFNGQTTAAIPYNASASAVEAALSALSTIGSGGVAVSGAAAGPWTVEFTGTLGGVNVPEMIGDKSALIDGCGAGLAGVCASITIATPQQGGPSGGPEVCSIAHQCKAGVAGPFAGAFASSGGTTGGLAVSPSGAPNAGNVLVADPGNSRMQEFTPAGAFVRAFGFAVDTAQAGTGFEVCTTAADCGAGSAGSGTGQFAITSPRAVAVDSTGKTYAVDSQNFRVETFDSSGGSPAVFAQSALGVNIPALTGVAIGASNRVFAIQPCPPTTSSDFATFCPGATISEHRLKEIDSSGSLLDTSLVGADFSNTTGLAVNQGNDRAYIATAGGSPGNRVWVLDAVGSQPPPILTVNPPTEITEHTARFSGTVNPNGLPGINASYHFEYSRNGVTWTRVATDVNLGNGTSPVNVPVNPAEGEATGLEANTFYRIRILATRAFGAGTTVSPELTFLTDGVKPAVDTFHPQSHTDTGARLVGRLNANNLATSYHFEYGKTTAYGSSAPVPSASASDGVSRLVFQTIEGLEPSTTYHHRLVATNSEGTTYGSDVTFRTYAAGMSTPPQRAYEMVTPPFKATRSTTAWGSGEGNESNPGIPSIDGNSMVWSTAVFPLTDDVKGPSSGDKRIMTRTPEGWVWKTLNTRPLTSKTGSETSIYNPVLVKQAIGASTADLKSFTWSTSGPMELLPSLGPAGNRTYTRRDNTGTEGFSPWTVDSRQAFDGDIGTGTIDIAKFNDDGSALVRWGTYSGLAEDPDTVGDDDPSDEQIVRPRSSVYGQKATDPDSLPGAPKDLVNECTGTGGSATLLPARVGTGVGTDTIGTQSCEESGDTPLATGTGIRSKGSSTLTSVATDTGAFGVGQFISGLGISSGTKITAVGSGTLTMSGSALCGAASVRVWTANAGSPVLRRVETNCGKLAVGQTLAGTGIPAGATITAVEGLNDNTVTLSVAATVTGDLGTVEATAPAGTQLTAESQHVTSSGGARAGAFASIGAISNDGNRVFFTSPDWSNSFAPSACTTGVGGNTSCPPQLFVRQYDSSGEPTVRWISRAQGVGTQQIGQMGAGAVFQGASKDGRHVYFQTNAPLTPDDPNGGNSITTGTASGSSWDLYRYTLPASLDSDPAGGTLTRITGGPAGNADPGTNTVEDAGLRYLSDDGRRAYFLTTATIAGAENSPPSGSDTAPGGAVGNTTTRNLYLFDDRGSSPRWRFIARIPYFSSTALSQLPEALNRCASSGSRLEQGQISSSFKGRAQRQVNCFRGTPDGDAIVFFTAGRLTADDRDDAGDVYLFDAKADELTRVSAGLPDVAPYPCLRPENGPPNGYCNADLGIRITGGRFLDSDSLGFLDGARGWGGGRHYNVAVDGAGNVSVFFESQSRLVPEDTNGDYMDVYQWRNGDLSLISPGNSAADSFYSGNGVDGRDVFMFTSARIDPREIDDGDFDIYNARIGGGFPYAPPPTPCRVLVFDCEGEAIAGPTARGAASAALSGVGNVKPAAARCNKNQVRRAERCVAKKALANRACAKRKGKARQRCVRSQVQRLGRLEARGNRANADRRNSR